MVDVWVPILEVIEDALQQDRRPNPSCRPRRSWPAGVVAHHAMPKPARREGYAGWTPEEVADQPRGRELVAHLHPDLARTRAAPSPSRTARADRVGSVWDGIAGKFTPSGRFAIGGPKEVGYAVADALYSPTGPTGTLIRQKK